MILLLLALVSAPTPNKDWTTWAGPNRNFIVDTTGLADKWPDGGPKQLWTRSLGEGYAGIAEENGILYTGYRRGSEDVITALDEKTGKTIWEYVYSNPFVSAAAELGPGPYAMPQVLGDRIVTASGTGKVHSLDKKTGKAVWSHDLYQEFNGTRVVYGYSCMALPYKNTLIYLVGGEGNAAMAFDQATGKVVWKNLTYQNGYSSPLLINVDGQEQVVGVFGTHIVGFSPTGGKEYWHYDHLERNAGINISLPAWAPGNMLYVGTAYGLGSRVLELHQTGGKTEVKQLWYNNRYQLHFGSAILDGGTVYISSGHGGPVFLTAIDLKTGATKWQDRTFKKAQLLKADGKMILLDEDGELALLRVTPEKMEVLSKAEVAKNNAWTVPTLVGTKLYVRDRRTISAYEIGK